MNMYIARYVSRDSQAHQPHMLQMKKVSIRQHTYMMHLKDINKQVVMGDLSAPRSMFTVQDDGTIQVRIYMNTFVFIYNHPFTSSHYVQHICIHTHIEICLQIVLNLSECMYICIHANNNAQTYYRPTLDKHVFSSSLL